MTYAASIGDTLVVSGLNAITNQTVNYELDGTGAVTKENAQSAVKIVQLVPTVPQ